MEPIELLLRFCVSPPTLPASCVRPAQLSGETAGADTATAAESASEPSLRTSVPEPGSLLLQPFSPFDVHADVLVRAMAPARSHGFVGAEIGKKTCRMALQPLVQLQTRASASAVVSLPAGRHLFQLRVRSAYAAVISVASSKVPASTQTTASRGWARVPVGPVS